MASGVVRKLRPADRENGYTFGCDGFVTKQQAAEFLSVSPSTVDRLVKAEKLRKGKTGANKQSPVRICKRSLTLYAASLEF